MPDLSAVRPTTIADTKLIADYGKELGAEFDVAKLLDNERMIMVVKGTATACVYVSEVNQHVNVFFLFPCEVTVLTDSMRAVLKVAVGDALTKYPECASWPAFASLQSKAIAESWQAILLGTTIEPVGKSGEWRIVMSKTKDFVEAMAKWL